MMRTFARRWAASTRLAALGALLAAGAGACTTVLGIEDLHREGADAGAGSATGGGGAAGSRGGGTGGGSGGSTGGASGAPDASLGSSGSGGSGGSGGGLPDASLSTGGSAGTGGAGAGGAAEASAGSGGLRDASAEGASGGSGGTGGSAGTGGGAGTGGSANTDAGARDAGDSGTVAPTITVQGHVIDAWRRAVSGVKVTIGTATATTDSAGVFSIPGVVVPYDVSFSLKPSGTYGWLYRGLRRSDPTLQAYTAFAKRYGTFHTQITNLATTGQSFDSAPLDASDEYLTVGVAFGSVDGAFGDYVSAADSSAVGQLWYSSNATISGSAHGLAWAHQGWVTYSPPTYYIATDGIASTIAEGNSAPASVLNLGKTTTLPSGSVKGTSSGQATQDRTNMTWLQYSDNAVIKLAQDTDTVTNFNYLVPQVEGATVSVMARKGDSRTAFALAHKDKLVAGAPSFALTIPEPANLDVPADGTTATTTTQFKWSHPSGANVVSLLRIALDDVGNNVLYVVTTNTTEEMPKFTDSALRPKAGAIGTWSVQVHGPYPSVDAATGPAGILDPYQTGELDGPSSESGSYSRSETWSLKY